MISDHKEEPYSKLLAMRFLKDCVKIGNKIFNDLVSDPKVGILNTIRDIILERKDQNPNKYGNQYFINNINL